MLFSPYTHWAPWQHLTQLTTPSWSISPWPSWHQDFPVNLYPHWPLLHPPCRCWVPSRQDSCLSPFHLPLYFHPGWSLMTSYVPLPLPSLGWHANFPANSSTWMSFMDIPNLPEPIRMLTSQNFYCPLVFPFLQKNQPSTQFPKPGSWESSLSLSCPHPSHPNPGNRGTSVSRIWPFPYPTATAWFQPPPISHLLTTTASQLSHSSGDFLKHK